MNAKAMEGRQIRVNIIINGKIIEQVNSFKYLGCNIATHKMNMGLEDNIEKYNKINGNVTRHFRSLGSSVSIVSDCGLDDWGSIPDRGRRFFFYPLRQDRLWGPPSLLYNGYRGSFPRGVMLTTHPHLVPRLRMSRSYTSFHPKRLHGV
jgi:hypothetical protein